MRFPLSGSIFSRSCTLLLRFLPRMRLPMAKAEGFLLAFRRTLGHRTCTLRKRPLSPISVAPLHHDPRPAPDASPYDICRVAQMFAFVNNGVSVLVFHCKLFKNCEQLFYRALHCILNILVVGMKGV